METIKQKSISIFISISFLVISTLSPVWSLPQNNEYLPPKNEYLPPNREYLPPKNSQNQKPINIIDEEVLELPSVNFYRTMQPQSGGGCPGNDEEANRKLVLKAYQHGFGDKNITGLENFYHEEYIQHNPLIADGLESIRKLLKAPGIGGPVQIEFMRSVAEGDLVWTHAKLPFFGKTYAAVDIFRIECGKIREHWDVLQDINLQNMPSMNSHPFF